MERLAGHHVGKYRILGEIGRGTVGSVYRAYDPDLDRDVAIKILSPRSTWDQNFVQDFVQRARLTARLQHPHLVAVYDLGQREGWYCIVMELLEGISLHDLARLRGGLQLNEVCAITRQLAGALDYIHGQGLVHGDVRAGNAILTPPDRVVLTELGVVRASWEGRIAAGAVTAAIAPEQVSGAELGPWTDLYSLGAIVYELLTARPLFTAETVPALLHQVLNWPVPPLAPPRPDLPAAAEQVLQRALAKDPQARYGSGAALAMALEEAAARPAPPMRPAWPSVPAGQAGPAAPGPDQPAPLVFSTAPGAGPVGTLSQAAAPGEPAARSSPPSAGPAAPEARPQEVRRIVSAAPGSPPPAAPTPASAAVPPPRRPVRPGSPAERLVPSRAAITRVAPAPAPEPEPAAGQPAPRRPPPWLWVALGAELLILLVGVVLLVLFLVGK